MCNAYNLKTSLTAIGEAAMRQLDLPLVFPPGVSAETSNTPVPLEVFPRRDGLILKPADPREPARGLAPAVAHWNLTPYFHQGPLKAWKASTNNCRSETMATLPAFREAYQRRRCLIPATSFVEWTGPKGHKTAHAISRADGGLLFLAGLWDRCLIEGARIESYTMVMIDAVGEDWMARFHDRQPVLLDAVRASTWLDLAADPRPILKPAPAGTLVADPPEPVAA
jgi:putative SOS response-associated peptidase YedK